jgi:hypothetical protein
MWMDKGGRAMLNISNELKTKLIEAKSAEEVAASRIARRPWKMAAGVARTMPAIRATPFAIPA